MLEVDGRDQSFSEALKFELPRKTFGEQMLYINFIDQGISDSWRLTKSTTTTLCVDCNRRFCFSIGPVGELVCILYVCCLTYDNCNCLVDMLVVVARLDGHVWCL
jgi:hypothetical protein